MNDPIDTIEVKNITHNTNYRIEIYYDDNPINPRTEFDNLGEMVGFHPRYRMGDKHSYTLTDAKAISNRTKKYIVLPVYLLDHSGLQVNTTGFNDPWDSGQVGWIWVSKEKIRKEYGWKAISKKRKLRIEGYLMGEVTTYNRYLNCDYVGYVVYDEDNVVIDSQWGFDNQNDALREAQATIDYEASLKNKA